MSGGAAEGVWGLNGGGQSVGGAAVSNSARRYIMESNTEPMDQTRAERRIPMLIVFRVGGKSQFCLESAMSELARERGPSSSSESNHPFVRARSWQCKSFSLSSTATTRVSSIISRREAEFENQFRILMAKRREGAGGKEGGVFNSFVVVGCRAFLHPSILLCPIDSGHLTLSSLPSPESESRDRPTNDAAAAAAAAGFGTRIDFPPKVIESCAANGRGIAI